MPPEQSILCGVGHASVIQLVANQYVSECRTRVLRAISRSLPLALLQSKNKYDSLTLRVVYRVDGNLREVSHTFTARETSK